jgi:alkanesulfonate monooxygenase SsuD/methylene tetrahydromethanopterin reductase-like flavin-dependent oxidoreductase (luciferase family)
MVLTTNLIGTPEMVRARLQAHRDAGVNTIRVQPTGRTMEEQVDTLGRLMELVREVAAAPASV